MNSLAQLRVVTDFGRTQTPNEREDVLVPAPMATRTTSTPWALRVSMVKDHEKTAARYSVLLPP